MEDPPKERKPKYDFKCRSPKCGHVTRTKHAPGEIAFCGECKLPSIVPEAPPSVPA